MIRTVLILVLGCTSVSSAWAQDSLRHSGENPLVVIKDVFSEDVPDSVPTPDILSELTLNLDAETKESALASLRAHFDYRRQGYAHRQRVFDWQFFASKVIFWVVVFLVLVGVFFSWIQFRHAMQRSAAATGGPDGPSLEDRRPSTTSLEASPKGVKVSSDVLGVIILVVSLLFFYLYLVHVYPIEDAF